MECPNCLEIAVDSAVFCNHCGTRMPLACPGCRAANPPESRYCYQCGNSLPASNSSVSLSQRAKREIRIRDIGIDLKNLSVDMAAYSAPRIRRGGLATARGARALAAYSVPRIRSLAQRLKPYQSEPPPPPAIPTHPVADVAADMPSAESDAAVACPRCHNVSEPGSLFCFSCGLPFGDLDPSETGRAMLHTGRPAGFWRRFVAWLIDLFILTSVQLVMIAVRPGFAEYFAGDPQLHWVDLLGFLVGALYYTLAVSIWATTIGKRALGMHVLLPDGSKVGPGRAAARYFASILSMLIFGIGYLMIGLRSDKRGLHDLICDTVVARR